MYLFFRRKPVNSLTQALQLAEAAISILMEHKRQKSFMPTEDDFDMLLCIAEAFHKGHAITFYVERSLRQRQAGEPEGIRRWHDKEVFDYHYPP